MFFILDVGPTGGHPRKSIVLFYDACAFIWCITMLGVLYYRCTGNSTKYHVFLMRNVKILFTPLMSRVFNGLLCALPWAFSLPFTFTYNMAVGSLWPTGKIYYFVRLDVQ